MAKIARSISQFKGALKAGGVRPTMFQVEMDFPDGTTTSVQDAANKASFLCKGAQIPASNVGVIEVPFRGRKLKVAGDRSFESWTVTVINDSSFTVRKALEKWSEKVQNMNFALGETLLSNYFKDLSVHQLDRDGQSLRSYKIFDAWPSAISPIDLDFGTTDTVEEYQVTFEYQFWNSSSKYNVGNASIRMQDDGAQGTGNESPNISGDKDSVIS